MSETFSVVGVRAYWSCAWCGVNQVTRQIVRAGDAPDLPAGWLISITGQTVCAAHDGVVTGALERRAA